MIRRRGLTFALAIAALAGSCLGPADVSPPSGGPQSRTSPTSGNSDLVYVVSSPAWGVESSATVHAVRPESGEVVAKIRARQNLGAMALTGDEGFFVEGGLHKGDPIRIHRVDLRTGRTLLTIDGGVADVVLRSALEYDHTYPLGERVRPIVAVSPDGRSVSLLRFEAVAKQMRVDRYDAATGRRIATAEFAVTEGAPYSASLYALHRGYLLHYERTSPATRVGHWLVLDEDLREKARVDSTMPGLTWLQRCDPEPLRLGPGRGWMASCTYLSYTEWDLALFDDDGAFAGRLELPPAFQIGFPAGWRLAPDGTVVILTNKPALMWIDPVGRRVIDKRNIVGRLSLPRLFGPTIALAKMETTPHPRSQITRDASRAFLSAYPGDFAGWWHSVASIDLREGVVRAAYDLRSVFGIHLSVDDRRLYALSSQDWSGERQDLVGIDVVTGKVISRHALPSREPFVIVTVAAR